MTPRFSQITETPGVGATREQLAMLATRYELAARNARSGPVLEIACGTGIGLGILADAGGRVVGTDIDADNVRIARETWKGDGRISIEAADVAALEYPDASFATIVCFEALYYFEDMTRSLHEMVRLLSPGGTLILCTVNPGWSGFNRSPFARDYPVPANLSPILVERGCDVEVFGAFADRPRGMIDRVIGSVRRIAVRLHLIPGSMRGKEMLKRLFLGGVTPMPSRLKAETSTPAPMSPLPIETASGPWKVFYITAKKNSTHA